MATATLLSSTTPLTKKYTKLDDGYDVNPYPLIENVTSSTHEYRSIEELYALLCAGANTGNCLLKGKLSRQVNRESRRGLNVPLEPTQLLVIDYDRHDGFSSVDELLYCIDPALASVSYVWQHSTSAGIQSKPGIRGHAFILLTEPVSPPVIKEWLIKTNLTVPEFTSRINLSLNAMALCYPLDVSINQNDKLIYLAPPQCIGFEDPIPPEERIKLVLKEEPTFTLAPSINPQRTREIRDNLLEKLQESQGIKKRAPKYTTYKNHEVITNPTICVVTEVQDCGEFVRLNLNGCSRFPYWYFKDDPEILFNFRGEEPAFIKDIIPEYHAQFLAGTAETAKTIRPIVFRDPITDTYYNGIVDYANKTVEQVNATGSKDRLFDFLAQYGRKPPAFVEDWTVEYDPTINERVDPQNRWINTFISTEYLVSSKTGKYPPTIEKFIRHICVDDVTHDYFINWLAFVIQKRQMSGTAWLFQGTEGTGKGTLFHKILRPILGATNTRIIETKDLEDNFNEFIAERILIFLDEGDIAGSKTMDRLMAKLRNYITEDYISIRRMRQAARNIRNWSNWIVATNVIGSLKISERDRRWNIAPRQEKPIETNDEEIALIRHELRDFADYLLNWQIDHAKVTKPLMNEAKRSMITLGKTGAELILDAIRDGNLEFFTDKCFDSQAMPPKGYFEYESIVRSWANQTSEESVVTTNDLIKVYNYLSGKETNEKAFGILLANYGITVSRKRINGWLTRYITTKFVTTEDTTLPERPNNIIPFNKSVQTE